MTPELFMQWKKKRMEERDAGLASQRAERAKTDRMRYLHTPSTFADTFADDCMSQPTGYYLLTLLSFPSHFSGRELFLSDASVFVDDEEAYEKYQREEEPDGTEQQVNFFLFM